MTLTTFILTNTVLAAVLVYALVHFLTHGVHADRRHRASRVAELSALPVDVRDRIAA
jgi:hypothetical protein